MASSRQIGPVSSLVGTRVLTALVNDSFSFCVVASSLEHTSPCVTSQSLAFQADRETFVDQVMMAATPAFLRVGDGGVCLWFVESHHQLRATMQNSDEGEDDEDQQMPATER